MKRNNRVFPFFLVGGCAVASLLSIPAVTQEKTVPPSLSRDAASLVESLSQKIDALPGRNSWSYRAVTINRNMTKKWTAAKTTTVEKSIRIKDGRPMEEILKAEETKDGKTRDVTEAYLKHLEAWRKKGHSHGIREGELSQGAPQEIKKRIGPYSIGMSDILPFKEERRIFFNFNRLEDAEIDGQAVMVLRSSSKFKNEKLLEGVYYIDRKNVAVMKAVLRPSKMPRLVKDASLETEFELLPSGHYVPKRVSVKVNAGIFIKRVRMEIEEIYSDHEILNEGTFPKGTPPINSTLRILWPLL